MHEAKPAVNVSTASSLFCLLCSFIVIKIQFFHRLNYRQVDWKLYPWGQEMVMMWKKNKSMFYFHLSRLSWFLSVFVTLTQTN